MKKLMVLAAVAAMASGAWAEGAEYTYNLILDVYNQPSSSHTSYYLLDVSDKNNQRVIAYATSAELVSYNPRSEGQTKYSGTYAHGADDAASKIAGGTLELPAGATVMDHKVSDISSTGGLNLGNEKFWKLDISFLSTLDPNSFTQGTSEGIYQIVASNPDKDAVANWVTYGLKIDSTTQNVVGGTFSGSYTYTNVPEPTSGLLLLLGVAGLALKRKRM